METFTPVELQRKSALELFQMRKRVVNELITGAGKWCDHEAAA
jgi:hypothetical protein